MSTQTDLIPLNSSSTLRFWACTGAFVFEASDSVPIGNFQVLQIASGKALVQLPNEGIHSHVPGCAGFAGIKGRTSEGIPIRIENAFTSLLPVDNQLRFKVNHVELGNETSPPHWVEVDITNFRFQNSRQPQAATLVIHYGDFQYSLEISPFPDCQQRIDLLETVDAAIPTAKLTFRANDQSASDLLIFLADFTYSLSLIQSRPIHMSYLSTLDAERALLYARFGDFITKNDFYHPHSYQPLTKEEKNFTISRLPEVVAALQSFRLKCDKHNVVVKAWMDAKSDKDFLQARTLKLVVVIEALCRLTFGSGSDLKFKQKLSQVFSEHNLTVAERDIDLFVHVRNSIVHEFDYSGKEFEMPPDWPPTGTCAIDQHFFVANFVDRIVQQLFRLTD